MLDRFAYCNHTISKDRLSIQYWGKPREMGRDQTPTQVSSFIALNCTFKTGTSLDCQADWLLTVFAIVDTAIARRDEQAEASRLACRPWRIIDTGGNQRGIYVFWNEGFSAGFQVVTCMRNVLCDGVFHKARADETLEWNNASSQRSILKHDEDTTRLRNILDEWTWVRFRVKGKFIVYGVNRGWVTWVLHIADSRLETSCMTPLVLTWRVTCHSWFE